MPNITWDELKQAKLSIEAVGGRVKLPASLVVCWGEVFQSLRHFSNDQRCVVAEDTLKKRLRMGMTLEEAAGYSRESPNRKEIVCWGEQFPSIGALSRDIRCQVGAKTLRDKLQAGMPPEEAVKNGLLKREVKSIDEVLRTAQRRKP